ncbi:MAG: hypothetical protein ABI439_06100 [Rhodospirillales bacterium]
MMMIDRQFLARLPLRFWIQLALGLVVLCVLAVFGFVLLLGALFIALGLGLVFQLWAWFHPRAPRRDVQPTLEGEYRVIDPSDKDRR